MIHLTRPASENDFSRYYHFRWRQLRAPWGQPVGSERDDKDATADHIMVVDDHGEIIGVGRLHRLDEQRARIRYMAVAEQRRRQGAGRRMIEYFEQRCKQWRVAEIILDARESAVAFYQACGFVRQGKSHLLFGEIQHFRMRKTL